jgi:hypothetical protein
VQWRVLWIVAVIVCIALLSAPEPLGFILDPLIIGGLLFWKFAKSTR